MRIEHEAAYRSGDKSGMDEEGFGADGKETEVQEDNQAEAGERGERFGQSGKEAPGEHGEKGNDDHHEIA